MLVKSSTIWIRWFLLNTPLWLAESQINFWSGRDLEFQVKSRILRILELSITSSSYVNSIKNEIAHEPLGGSLWINISWEPFQRIHRSSQSKEKSCLESQETRVVGRSVSWGKKLRWQTPRKTKWTFECSEFGLIGDNQPQKFFEKTSSRSEFTGEDLIIWCAHENTCRDGNVSSQIIWWQEIFYRNSAKLRDWCQSGQRARFIIMTAKQL